MNTPPLFLNDIANFLQNELTTHHYPESERGGIHHPSERPVRRLGLALEPFAHVDKWVSESQMDALWLHRPWQLDMTKLPPDVGVLSHHLPFDETLSIGYNPRLAKQIGAMSAVEPFGYKQDTTEDGTLLPQRSIGMIIDVEQQEFDHWLATVKNMFGGYDRAEAGHGAGGWNFNNCRIAIAGAMTDALIREAADRGAHLYLTGAYRKPGQQAVDETGMAVIAVGHRRSEEWGLRALADLLSKQWPIECVVHEYPIQELMR